MNAVTRLRLRSLGVATAKTVPVTQRCGSSVVVGGHCGSRLSKSVTRVLRGSVDDATDV